MFSQVLLGWGDNMHNSKLILSAVAAVGAIAGIGAASAADLAARPYTKAPPVVVAPVYDWSGFYIGGQIGYDWRRDSNVERLLATGVPDGWRANSSPAGVVGGFHAGYNVQSGMMVYGLEADIEAADISGSGLYSLNGGPPITDHINSKTDWQGSFRGRIGVASNNVLFYGTGGVSFADIQHDYVTGLAGPPITSFSETRAGWTLGAGIEYGITANWRARIEYRYTDYGTLTNNVGTQFLGALQDQRITDNSVRGAISYKFGTPVVAKY
jgi:outer membrane immunogenic protein